MSILDEYFRTEPTENLHPKARYWRRRFEPGVRAICEVRRPRDGLTFKPAKIYVTFYKGDSELDTDGDDWDPELDAELVRQGVRAKDRGNEALRFGLLLNKLLARAESRHGDGYYSSVLIDHIRNSPLGRCKPIEDILPKISVPAPDRTSSSYRDCKDEIFECLATVGKALVGGLHYSDAEAEYILPSAVANYLDERFSITNAALLGLG